MPAVTAVTAVVRGVAEERGRVEWEAEGGDGPLEGPVGRKESGTAAAAAAEGNVAETHAPLEGQAKGEGQADIDDVR